MKLISIIAVMAAAVLSAQVASAQVASARFSNPILIGGDSGTKGDEAARSSTATHLKFFEHPEAPGMVNFADPAGILDVPLFNPVNIHDVTATPGAKVRDVPLGHGESLDNPPSRASLNPNSGISPDDLTIASAAWSLFFGYNYQLASHNVADHRLVMADVRNEGFPGEFLALFGVDPLEAGLIGNAAGVTPYDLPLDYPAAIFSTGHPFQWCAPLPRLIFGPQMSYMSCDPLEHPAIGIKAYGEVFPYDVADIGTGLVSASYDSLNLIALPELGFGLEMPPISIDMWIAAEGSYPYSFVSPLAFFRNTGDPEAPYKFSGYTTWQWPHIRLNLPAADVLENLKYQLYKFLFTNFLIPPHTNPIAVEAIDLHGSSSGDVGHPDTDLAVAYQTTLFDFSNYIPNLAGQPRVFNDHHYHTWGEIIGKCEAPCTDANFVPVQQDPDALSPIFPDDVVSPFYFWRQVHQWGDPNCPGAETGAFECMNPSHVVDPGWYDQATHRSTIGAFTGPGMYDAAVLTDTVGAVRKQYVLVPTGGVSSDPAAPGNPAGIVYQIDPQGPHFWVKGWGLAQCPVPFLGGGPLAPAPDDPFSPHPANCLPHPATYTELPIILPTPIFVPSPKGKGWVPYEVNTGDLDGDKCQDFILTWRAKPTVDDPDNPEHVKFWDAAEGRMFSEYVTVGLRHEVVGGCSDPAFEHKLVQALDPNQKVEVASATIGDFYGDGQVRIAAGNLQPEAVGDGTSSAYAYLLAGPFFSGANIDRVRMGFKSSADMKNFWGVAKITADTQESGPDALASKQSLPLMLPEIGCRGANALPGAATPVTSIFETYVSILLNSESQAKDLNTPFPFAEGIDDDNYMPVPQRCVAKSLCTVTVCNQATGQMTVTNQPLWADNSCCQKFEDVPGPMFDANPCLKYLCPADFVGDVYSDTNNKVFCQAALGSDLLCVGEGVGANLDRDDGPEGGGDSEFAAIHRPDEVRESNRGAIVGMGVLSPAQMLGALPRYEYKLGADKLDPKLFTGLRTKRPTGLQATSDIPFGGLIYKMAPKDQRDKIDPEILKQMEGAVNAALDDDPFLAYWYEILAAAAKQEFRKRDEAGQGDKTEPVAGCSLLIRDAWAVSPPNLAYDKIRFPKGTVFPGETTAVVRLTPKTCNYNGTINADIGEQCDTAQLSEDAAMAQITQVCTKPEGGIPFNCDMRDCSCAYQQPQCMGKADVECDDDLDCPADKSCGINCTCGAAPGVAAALTNDCSVQCMGYSSNEMKDYITTNLNKPLQDAAKRPDYDFYCQPEQRVAIVCQADHVLAEDGGVLPSAVYQTGGSVLVDYIHNAGVPIQTIEEGKPIQLLPTAGKTLKIWKGQTTAANLNLSGSVPMSSVDSSVQITAGESSFDINNGIFQWEVHPVTAGQSFSIASGDTTINSSGDGAFFVSYVVTQPACPTFTQAEGYQEGCLVGPTTNYEEVLKEIKAKAAAGPVTSAHFSALSPTSINQTYHYRFKQLQGKDDGTVGDLPAGFSTDVQPGPRGMSCGCNATGLPPALSDILAALSVGIAYLAVRRRMRR